jgi:hypothetical protein
MSGQHIPGLELAVTQDAKVLRFGGYGVSYLVRGHPVTGKTIFAKLRELLTTHKSRRTPINIAQ